MDTRLTTAAVLTAFFLSFGPVGWGVLKANEEPATALTNSQRAPIHSAGNSSTMPEANVEAEKPMVIREWLQKAWDKALDALVDTILDRIYNKLIDKLVEQVRHASDDCCKNLNDKADALTGNISALNNRLDYLDWGVGITMVLNAVTVGSVWYTRNKGDRGTSARAYA